ncbi:MAG TPA: MaoC family dehydratase N-terminal domain-containing protein [Methylomirabilota bacterium]|nr:MaoC family dehydratase N-terminal domain-containing protein [Methylomirabilota bacterium]
MGIDRAIIGRKGPEFTCTIERGKVKEFAAAVGDYSDLFWDDTRSGGIEVPPTFSHIFRSGKMELLMTDAGLDATKFLHGEHEIVYHRPLVPGDRITYSIEIVDAFEKQGRRSGPMDVVVLETRLRDSAGAPVQTIRQTFVAKR